MKPFIQKIGASLKSIGHKIARFYDAKIDPFISKIGYALTHNPLIRMDDLTLRLFGIKIKVTRKRRDAFYGYMFISLWLIGLLIFTLYPMIYALYLSFFEAYYNLQTGITTTFVGFDNYFNIFRSQTLVPLFANYVIRMLVSVPLIIVFSIIIAVLINVPMKGKSIFRTIFAL